MPFTPKIKKVWCIILIQCSLMRLDFFNVGRYYVFCTVPTVPLGRTGAIMAKKKAPDALGDLLDSSSGEVVNQTDSSPIDHLPVAAGKRRRGRPRKIREAAAAEGQTSETASKAGSPPADISKIVKSAVAEAIQRNKPAGPTTRRGIVGLVKQVASQEARRAVKQELPDSPVVETQVRQHLANEEKEEILADSEHRRSHPYWHLLRMR